MNRARTALTLSRLLDKTGPLAVTSKGRGAAARRAAAAERELATSGAALGGAQLTPAFNETTGEALPGPPVPLTEAEAELREVLRLEAIERRTRSLRSAPIAITYRRPESGGLRTAAAEPTAPMDDRASTPLIPEPVIAANAACDWPSAIRHARSVRGSTTTHHAIGAGRCEARGWGWPYFSQPICGDDRSLFSPAPSPLVPRQWAQSANSLGKWRARQDSNLRPSA